jgi:hypothetical protein
MRKACHPRRFLSAGAVGRSGCDGGDLSGAGRWTGDDASDASGAGIFRAQSGCGQEERSHQPGAEYDLRIRRNGRQGHPPGQRPKDGREHGAPCSGAFLGAG